MAIYKLFNQNIDAIASDIIIMARDKNYDNSTDNYEDVKSIRGEDIYSIQEKYNLTDAELRDIITYLMGARLVRRSDVFFCYFKTYYPSYANEEGVQDFSLEPEVSDEEFQFWLTVRACSIEFLEILLEIERIIQFMMRRCLMLSMPESRQSEWIQKVPVGIRERWIRIKAEGGTTYEASDDEDLFIYGTLRDYITVYEKNWVAMSPRMPKIFEEKSDFKRIMHGIANIRNKVAHSRKDYGLTQLDYISLLDVRDKISLDKWIDPPNASEQYFISTLPPPQF